MVNSAIANGVPREQAEQMAEALMERPTKSVKVKREDGTVETVTVPAEEEDEENEDLLSPDDSIIILTGANASGKSVFLKMVAIIVYMVRYICSIEQIRRAFIYLIRFISKCLHITRHTLVASCRLIEPWSVWQTKSWHACQLEKVSQEWARVAKEQTSRTPAYYYPIQSRAQVHSWLISSKYH